MSLHDIFILFYAFPICVCLLGGMILLAVCDFKEYFPIKVSERKNWLGEHPSWPFFVPSVIPVFNLILAIWYLINFAYIVGYWIGWLIVHMLEWFGLIVAMIGIKIYEFMRDKEVRQQTKECLKKAWLKISWFCGVLWELLVAPIKIWRHKE